MKNQYAWLRRLPLLLGMVFCLSLMLAVYFLKDKFQKPPQTKKIVQQITMIQQPPPPPPEQTPPEPEVTEEKIEEPELMFEPEPAPAPANPDDAKEAPVAELGLEAEGAAGSDSFGLVARKGGRGILGGSGSGNAILWYGGQLKRQLEDGLQPLLADTVAMTSGYSVIIEVWIDADGRIDRSELSSGSGKAEVDQVLRSALHKLRVVVGKPPEGMPQPVKIRLTTRV